MLVIVGVVSQKGGVGKSTVARAVATLAASVGIKVKIADLDPQQQTIARWEERREANSAGPPLEVASFRSAAEAIGESTGEHQLLIIDAPARASQGTLEIARHADLIVQPSGPGIDDLDPAIILFHELVREGVPKERLVVALCRVANQAEASAARAYVEKAGFTVLPGSIPERAVYRVAHNHGRAISEMQRKHHEVRTDMLLERLLSLITESVKVRIEAAKPTRRKGSAA
jgi:chromosome partitioning protein